MPRHVLRRRDGLLEIRGAPHRRVPSFELALRAGLIAAPLAVCAACALGGGGLLFLFAGLASAIALGLRCAAALEQPGLAEGALPASVRRLDEARRSRS
ncbi:MAG TPA: hypothetical protein VFE30_06195 [Anaeromyxobacteraceae bacterium]|nr:hypothetical protein [Anaeromyxobacteraceae bacterium]